MMSSVEPAAINSQSSGERRTALYALASMLMFALAAWLMTPTRMLTEVNGKPDFEALLPRQFGDWREEQLQHAQIVNPQQEELLHRIYTQLVTRTYVNSRQQRVMVALAYGEDQRDGMQLHYPEVCYPAQGFMLIKQQPAVLELAGRSVPAKRLVTELGRSRRESVTYWTLLGDRVFRGGMNKKLAEMRFGLNGLIADGLLFRVSSIGADPEESYALHDDFSRQLLAALSPQDQRKLVGQP